MNATGILKSLPDSLGWMVFFRIEAIRQFADDSRIGAMFFLPPDLELTPFSHVILTSAGRFVAPEQGGALVLCGESELSQYPPQARSLYDAHFDRFGLFPADEADCIGLGLTSQPDPALLHLKIREGYGYASAVFRRRPVQTDYALLKAVGVEYLGGEEQGNAFVARFRNRLPHHLQAGALAGFSRTGHCNEFFFRHGEIDAELRGGLLKAADDRVRAGQVRAHAAATLLARAACRSTLAMTCQPPSPAQPFEYGDLVPLGFLLRALQTYPEPVAPGTIEQLREKVVSARQDGLWAFHSGRLITATDSALVLQALSDRESVQALERFRAPEGGYYPQLWADTREAGRMQAAAENRHWRQPDFATTCMIRGLRAKAGLSAVTPLDEITQRFETRSGLYFANPFLVDLTLAEAIQDDPDAAGLRQRLVIEILAARNEDHSFGQYDVPCSTALAVMALSALGYRGRQVRLAQLRLLDFVEPSGSMPECTPFYSTFLAGEAHELSVYRDTHRIIATSVGAMAWGAACDAAQAEADLPDSGAAHPRYRCATHAEYIFRFALPPYDLEAPTNPNIPSHQRMVKIVERASTLEERLRGVEFEPVEGPDEETVNRRLDAWCGRASKGDRVLLERLLELQGFSIESVKGVLGDVRLKQPANLPEWCGVLRESLRKAGEPASAYPYMSADDSYPFQHLLTPFVETAEGRIRAQVGALYERLSPEARTEILSSFLYWLTQICSASFALEFAVFRLGQSPGYEAFLEHMRGGGLAAFFEEYAALARAISTLVINWSGAMAEMIERLEADRADLAAAFAGGRDLGEVVKAAAGLSDPHHNGRTVVSLEFSSGLKLVYKPKRLEAEHAYQQLLEWMNGSGATLPLRGPGALRRPTHGWVEYIEHATCTGESELRAFYRRAGALLSIFHMVGASDMHYENLIASGEYPMVVDAETLISPTADLRTARDPEGWAGTIANRRLDGSVLTTHLLPNWTADAAHSGADISGLGSTGGETVDATVWRNDNPDQMAPEKVKVPNPRRRNSPFPEGHRAVPGDYLDEMTKGFAEGYHAIVSNRAGLRLPSSPLHLLSVAPMRLVFRDTYIYYGMLKTSLDPAAVRHGVDRSIVLEGLSRIVCAAAQRPETALPIVQAEKRSVERMDIPFLACISTENFLRAEGAPLKPEFFEEPAMERVWRRLEGMGPADLEFQLDTIRGSFYSKAISGAAALAGAEPVAPGPRATAAEASFVDAAIGVARDLERRAIWGLNRSVTWTGLVHHPEVQGWRFRPVAPVLYDGLAGVGIFLAALERTAKRPEYRELMAGLGMSLRRFAVDAARSTSWKKSSGFEIAAGNLIYPLIVMSELLDDSELLTAAQNIAVSLKAESIAGGAALDVHHGAAGVMLGLCALHQRKPGADLLEKARAGTAPLLAANRPVAGRSVALTRLAAASGEQFAATEGDAWAKGKAGLALQAMFHRSPNQADAVEQAIGEQCHCVDAVDGGEFGLISLLAEAAVRMDRPEWLDQARQRAAASIARAESRGGFRLFREVSCDAFAPGFYRGTSGIGYTLLTLGFPGALPSVVLWN